MTDMSEMSMVTNDEIMEMTQLVFDRYYTELKRQLRRGEIDEESAELYCTRILAKVYQAIQSQGVNKSGYEVDACAIPIINEELNNILVPMHLNNYQNKRSNMPEKEWSVTDETVEPGSETELSAEIRAQIRRILQEEFQMEPAQVKPVVVVVNMPATKEEPEEETKEETANESVEEEPEEDAAEEPVEEEPEEEAVEEPEEEAVEEPEEEAVEEPEEEAVEEPEEEVAEEPVEAAAEELIEEPVEVMGKSVDMIEVTEVKEAVVSHTETEPLPELDFDIEKLIQEPERKKKSHLWLWIPILVLLTILIWLTIGMLMSYDVIPDFDLGYKWFNETVFDLFMI